MRAKEASKLNGSSRKKSRRESFVLCVRNKDYRASLELRKVYSVIEDRAVAKHGLIRVVDESGEDYLYPAAYFIVLRLPESVKMALARAS